MNQITPPTAERLAIIRGSMADYGAQGFEPELLAALDAQAVTHDARVTELLAANNAELERRRAAEAKVEELSKCGSCGEPLSRDCPHCKHLWER